MIGTGVVPAGSCVHGYFLVSTFGE
jgi:hypothetical protein